jgi:hypothetical protein
MIKDRKVRKKEKARRANKKAKSNQVGTYEFKKMKRKKSCKKPIKNKIKNENSTSLIFSSRKN